MAVKERVAVKEPVDRMPASCIPMSGTASWTAAGQAVTIHRVPVRAIGVRSECHHGGALQKTKAHSCLSSSLGSLDKY